MPSGTYPRFPSSGLGLKVTQARLQFVAIARAAVDIFFSAVSCIFRQATSTWPNAKQPVDD